MKFNLKVLNTIVSKLKLKTLSGNYVLLIEDLLTCGEIILMDSLFFGILRGREFMMLNSSLNCKMIYVKNLLATTMSIKNSGLVLVLKVISIS
jgi:hypothetical protein